jgi:SHS2 domain-containing protein
MWEHFPHDADMGVRGYGETKEEAFEEAAAALLALTTELSDVDPAEPTAISCTAPDDEQLLVEWLDALVFEIATGHRVFSRFEVRIDGGKLQGAAWGERRDPERHTAGVEVKGATFTELRVALGADGRWVAQCVVDV